MSVRSSYGENPAGRLLPLLEACIGPHPKSTNPFQEIAASLAPHLSDLNDPELHRLLAAAAFQLPDELDTAVARYLPDVPSSTRRKAVKVARLELLSVVDRGHPLSIVSGARTELEQVVRLLRIWREKLHLAMGPQPIVDVRSLAEIQAAIHDLAGMVDGAENLDVEVAAFLREHLAALARAVSDVRVRGATALREEIHRTVGAVLLNPVVANQLRDGEPRLRRLWLVVERLAHVAQVTSVPLAVALAVSQAAPTQLPSTSPSIHINVEAPSSDRPLLP